MRIPGLAKVPFRTQCAHMEPVPAWRNTTMAALHREPFDILILGGGITGAGVAREAALAGYRTALLERDDFAAGTSSRSSRLVHGGVRYLEHGHLGLVFESSRERHLLLSLAPHLVRPLAFTWPVYRGARVPRWKVRAGLLLYDALALFRNVQRHEGLDAEGTLAYEPGLNRQALVGGARYWDAATDDTRLTLANAQAAADAGAVVLNHCGAVAGLHEGASPDARLSGVVAEDRFTRTRFEVRARVIINATGPWSDATSALTGQSRGAQVFGSAGAHVAVPRQRIGNRDALTIVSPLDGRVMFVLPAGAHAIIGTTEQPAHRGPEQIRATVADVTYLLQSVNRIFPFAELTLDDVISAWCGIRPLALVRAGERSANAASREHAITTRADGQLSVTGGKLTTYRAMAADVLHHARQALGAAPATASAAGAHASSNTPLPGGDIISLTAVTAEASGTVHDAAVGERLATAFGSRWRSVWSYVQRTPALGQRIADDLPYLSAEVAHAVEREWACTFADVLVRRTHLAFETRDHGRSAARRIAPIMQAMLGWSDEELTDHLDAYDADVARIFTIDEMT